MVLGAGPEVFSLAGADMAYGAAFRRAGVIRAEDFDFEFTSFNLNAVYRWEYRPGSDIYVVYSDGRNTSYGGFPQLEDRSLVFKVTRLFRF